MEYPDVIVDVYPGGEKAPAVRVFSARGDVDSVCIVFRDQDGTPHAFTQSSAEALGDLPADVRDFLDRGREFGEKPK